MLNPQKTLEREALLRRHREIEAELAQMERNIRELEAQLPIEEQLCLKLRRFIKASIPGRAVDVRVEIGINSEKGKSHGNYRLKTVPKGFFGGNG